MSKRELQREASVQNILETAMLLFAEQGYDRTSIRMIAEKAGISLGLLYNYFGSKEELLRAILQRARKDILTSMEKPEGLTPFQNLEHHVRSTFKLLEQSPTFWRLHHSLRMQPGIQQVLGPEEIQEETDLVISMITQNLAAAGSPNPEADATLMFATLDGIAQHYLLLPQYPLQDVLTQYLLQLRTYLNA